MSLDDLEEARAKRAIKKKAAAGRGKRGPKRKSSTPKPQAEAQSGPLKVVTDPSMLQNNAARISEVEPAKTPRAPWRALVAEMHQDSILTLVKAIGKNDVLEYSSSSNLSLVSITCTCSTTKFWLTSTARPLWIMKGLQHSLAMNIRSNSV